MPNSFDSSCLVRSDPIDFYDITYSFDAAFIKKFDKKGLLSIMKKKLLYQRYSSNISPVPSGGLECNSC